jgi:hypothetical protein
MQIPIFSAMSQTWSWALFWLLVFVIGAAVGSRASLGTNFETALGFHWERGISRPEHPAFGKVIAAAPTNPRTSSPLPTSSMDGEPMSS